VLQKNLPLSLTSRTNVWTVQSFDIVQAEYVTDVPQVENTSRDGSYTNLKADLASWCRHDTKSNDVSGICSTQRGFSPNLIWPVMRATLVLVPPNAVCPIRPYFGLRHTLTIFNFDTTWSCDLRPACYSPSADKTDFIVQRACYLFSWSYLLFWVPGLSMYFFKRLLFIKRGKAPILTWLAEPHPRQ